MPTLKNAVFHNNDPTQLPAIFQGLDYLGSLEVEVPTMTKIRRVRRALGTAHRDFEEVRTDLIKRRGEEQDGQVSVTPEMPGWSAFLADYAALLEQTFEVAEVFTEADVKGLRVKEVELAKLGDLYPLAEDEKPAKMQAI